MNLEGTILKGIGGFYYVEAAGGTYECKARGIFRKMKIKPLVGDRVKITINGEESENTIDEILPRKNALVRPPLANIDQLFIISSVCKPNPSLFVIDKLTAIAQSKEIEPIIVFNKVDLKDGEELAQIYRKSGFQSFLVDQNGTGVKELRETFAGKISAFTGNSGVGKSTILNQLAPELDLSTGEISDKLGRGRHTTRHCELFQLCGGYIADTPGFSSLDLERCEVIMKEDLQYAFREFEPYLLNCKFTPSCAHIKEKGCAVLAALENGEIEPTRHESYVQMYEAVKDLKEWNLK